MAAATIPSRCLSDIYEHDHRVNLVRLRRNFGQTAGLKAGFDFARGEIIISMDGDLQHDPEEIPRFLEKIEEGFDLVSGWRYARRDHWLMRQIPSRAANWMMAKLVRYRPARFRDHLQGLPPRNHSGDSAIRRTASVYPGAGGSTGRADHGSAHHRSGSQEREEQLRHRPDAARFSGFDYREVPAGLLDAAAAVFWLAGRRQG